MLLSWQALTLGSELSQTTADAETGVTLLDDIIDVTILSCLIWISKLVCILLLLLSQECPSDSMCGLICLCPNSA